MVSIVANFYKSEKFLPKLLKSVFNQTYTDWELICVVDASPGKDVEIIERYVKKYSKEDKVRIIENKENLGISKSKKVGIDAARGEYMTFIDGDDFFANEALEKMVSPAINYNLDLVIMNYCRWYAAIRKRVDISVPFASKDYERVMEKEEFFDRCFINFFGSFFIHFAYWGKLYRTSILKNLQFNYPSKNDTVAEDKWFNMEVFQQINRAYFVDYIGYFWRWGGISSVRVDKTWTLTRDLDKHIEYFPYQMSLIEKYNYQKAYMPLLRTLKEKFIESLNTLCLFPCDSLKSERGRQLIDSYLGEEPIKQLRELKFSENEKERHIAILIENNDVNGLYLFLNLEHKERRNTHLLIDIFHTLFYYLR